MNNIKQTLQFLNEGGTFKKKDDGNLSVSFDSSSKDVDNTGKGTFDSRVFGDKKDILWGDGSKGIPTTQYPERVNSLLGIYEKVLKNYSKKKPTKIPKDTFIKAFDGQVTENIIKEVWSWIETGNVEYIKKRCEERIQNIKKIFGNGQVPSTLNRGLVNKVKGMRDAFNAMKAIIYYYNIKQSKPINIEKLFQKYPNINPVTKDNIKKMIESDDQKDIVAKAKNFIQKYQKQYEMYNNKYKRVMDTKGDRATRYNVFNIPETNIKCISLFYMDDFNFSDAIKHGNIRQNDLTDKLLGIKKEDRETDLHGNLKKLDVTYDDDIDVNDDDIEKNFSLHNVKDGHNKQNYGLNDKNYTSINKLIDKSVMYAAYAIKKEDVHPTKIVAAFSSSKFNDLYSKNLSQKTGIDYAPDFFKRNLIDAKVDDVSLRQKMEESKKFTSEEIESHLQQVRAQAYTEIAAQIKAPLDKFFKHYQELFATISTEKNSREKIDSEIVYDCLLYQSYNSFKRLLEKKSNEEITAETQNIGKYLCQLFLSKKNFYQAKSYDVNRVYKEASFIITTKVGKKVFGRVLKQMYDIMIKHIDMLKESGYALRLTSKSFKITNFQERYRPYLNNIYVVADEYLYKGEFHKQYKDADFLLIDEDVNSGATMKFCIDAIKEKLPDIADDRITCLANAYSDKSF